MFEFEERSLDLQLFADDLQDVKDDDPTKVDLDDGNVDDEYENEDEYGDDDFSKLAVLDEDEEELEEAEENEETEAKTKKEKEEAEAEEKSKDKKETAQKEPVFTKEQVEAIVQERLARDPYRNYGRMLEQKTGMTLQQLNEYAEKQQEEEEVKKYAEENMVDEEEARRQVRLMRENQRYKQEFPQMQYQLQHTQAMLQYINDKAKDINNPYVKKYEKEIDAFAENGRLCSFESAKNYILGQKLLSGELLDAIKSGAINKTLADIQKQGKVKVQGGSQSGRSSTEMAADEVDPFQKQIAAAMGVPLKEVIAERARIMKERRSGRF